MTDDEGRDRAAPSRRLGVHLQVIWRAVVFGLGAYAVIRVLIYLSREAGLLDWLH